MCIITMGSKLVPRASASGRQREKRGFGKRQSLQSVDCGFACSAMRLGRHSGDHRSMLPLSLSLMT